MFLSWVGAEIDHCEIEPPLDLPIRLLGETDAARLANALEPCGDVDAIAHQVAVALLDDVAQMYPNAKHDAALGRNASVTLNHAVLHFDRAAHRVHHAAELNNGSIAGSLDDAAVVHGDYGINQIATDRPKPRQRTIFVRAGEPAVTDYVRDKDSRDFPGLAHRTPMCGNLNRIPDPKLPKSKGPSRIARLRTGQTARFPANAGLHLPVNYLSVPVSQGTSATFECLDR